MNRVLYTLMLVALASLTTQPAHASEVTLEGRVIIGQNFTLNSGQTLNGDLVVVGGAVFVEHNASVQGDIVVIGGNLQLDGATSGDAVVIGGIASLGEQASLSGDVVTVGGTLERAQGAHIGGNIITNLPPPSLTWPNATAMPTPPVPPQPPLRFDFGPLGRMAGILLQALGLTALAMLLTALLHPQLDRVAQAAVSQPFVAGSIGLLTAFLAPIAVVVLAVTLILIPVALAAVMLLVLAWLFGVVALGLVVGERLTQAAHKTWEPVLSAGVGTFVLAIGVGTINLVPCVGWLAAVLVGLLGLGAAVITVFGTRSVLRSAATAPAADFGGPGSPPASAAS
jgi:hypothetical protein